MDPGTDAGHENLAARLEARCNAEAFTKPDDAATAIEVQARAPCMQLSVHLQTATADPTWS